MDTATEAAFDAWRRIAMGQTFTDDADVIRAAFVAGRATLAASHSRLLAAPVAAPAAPTTKKASKAVAMRKCCETTKGDAPHAAGCATLLPPKIKEPKGKWQDKNSERLTDGAQFSVVYISATKTWTGSLVVPGLSSFSGNCGGVFRLLRQLDDAYRRELRQMAETKAVTP